jgi:metal-responsive CopG/Arc/MetJ family transcriptional regulator
MGIINENRDYRNNRKFHMPKKIISVVLDEDTIKELEEFCNTLHASKAEIMRFAITWSLKNEDWKKIIKTLFA